MKQENVEPVEEAVVGVSQKTSFRDFGKQEAEDCLLHSIDLNDAPRSVKRANEKARKYLDKSTSKTTRKARKYLDKETKRENKEALKKANCGGKPNADLSRIVSSTGMNWYC